MSDTLTTTTGRKVKPEKFISQAQFMGELIACIEGHHIQDARTGWILYRQQGFKRR